MPRSPPRPRGGSGLSLLNWEVVCDHDRNAIAGAGGQQAYVCRANNSQVSSFQMPTQVVLTLSFFAYGTTMHASTLFLTAVCDPRSMLADACVTKESQARPPEAARSPSLSYRTAKQLKVNQRLGGGGGFFAVEETIRGKRFLSAW